MKTIGLLGGTSYPSTFDYYNLLNRLVNEALGGFHSAKIILYSIDYHEIKSHYGASGDKIPDLLKKELDVLCAMPIDGLIICNNTLHKALDILIKDNQLSFNGQVFHALHCSALEAKRLTCRKVLLLATKKTMTADFYKNYFHAEGIDVIIPDEEEMNHIQTIQTALSISQAVEGAEVFFKTLLQKYQGTVDAVVLGCTELPLVIKQDMTYKPLINPVTLQCEKAVEFLLS